MTLTIRQQLVADRSKTSRGINPCDYITVHTTGNTSAGADAAAHANLQSRGNSRSASWHYTVDDTEAVQSFPDDIRCWHAGDGRGHGNMSSIGIEICVNSDGDYLAAVRNAAMLVATKMAEHNIPLSRVLQHHHWSGKNCPAPLRAGTGGVTWAEFLAMVDSGGAPLTSQIPVVKPANPTPAPASSNYKASGATFKQGDHGPGVGEGQALLKKLGFYTGEVDSIAGRLTDKAVRDFQTAAGIEVDGIFGPMSRSNANAVPTYPGRTARGTRKRGITLAWQRRLKQLGHYTGKLDDDHGPLTDAAIAQAQKVRGLLIDRIGGPMTWTAIHLR